MYDVHNVDVHRETSEIPKWKNSFARPHEDNASCVLFSSIYFSRFAKKRWKCYQDKGLICCNGYAKLQ